MKFILATLFMLVGFICFSQTKAVTSEGEEVVLFDNGTWKYVNKAPEADVVIELNKTEFTKNKAASFPVKSKTTNAIVNIDPKKWSFRKGEEGEAAEYHFDMKGRDAYGMLITERIEISIESLKGIAFQNAQEAAPDIAVTKQEYRIVNGTKVLFMQMDGTIQGIKFTYLGYYYSSPQGTIQFLTYTGQSLLKDYESDLMNLLNGIEFAK